MNQALINFEDYALSGLIFNGVGCLFWVVAYVVLVWEIRKRSLWRCPLTSPVQISGGNSFGH